MRWMKVRGCTLRRVRGRNGPTIADFESNIEDEEMYDDEYDEEMDYGDEMEDREENVSDEEEEIEGMGPVEGLPGDTGLVEVIMGEPEDEEEEEETEEEEEDEDEDEDEDEESDESEEEDESEDLDESGEHLDIVDEVEALHQAIDDGAGSAWESGTDEHEEDEDDEDEGDYDGEGQDIDMSNPQHALQTLEHRFGDIIRTAIHGNDVEVGRDLRDFADRLLDGQPEGELDEGDEEDDADDDQDQDIYDDMYHRDEGQHGMAPPALGWDTLVVDQFPLDHRQHHHGHHHHHHHHGPRHTFRPSPFPVTIGGPRDPLTGKCHSDGSPLKLVPLKLGMRVDWITSMLTTDSEFRAYFRGPTRASLAEQDINVVSPLLRRNGGSDQDMLSRGPGRTVQLSGRQAMSIGLPFQMLGDLLASAASGRPEMHYIRHDGSTLILTDGGPSGVRVGRDGRHDGRRDMYGEFGAAIPDNTFTMVRWDEQAAMIFGGVHHEESLKLAKWILSKLTPEAMARERKQKALEAEQRRLREEEKKKLEQKAAEEEKAAQERAAAKAKQEAEERERRLAEEAEAARAAAAAAAEAAATAAQERSGEPEAMEGVESTAPAQGEAAGGGVGAATQQPGAGEATRATPRVTTTLRGATVDVTDLGIDPEYLAALPDEFREEVIAQTVSSRRTEAREAAEASGEQQPEPAFQEFLDALPEDLRMEILQQERQEQRRRQRVREHQQALAGAQGGPQDMDLASILRTFDPALREEVLRAQGRELMDHLPPDMADQARLFADQQGAESSRSASPGLAGPGQGAGQATAAGRDGQRRTYGAVVEMLSEAGVATLLRLMFIPNSSLRPHLYHALGDACENRQNRVEIINTLLQVLQDGSTDMDAVERSFNQLSLRARQPKDREQQTKTPQSLKRTLTTISIGPPVHPNSEASPLLLVSQCLDLLVELTAKPELHIPSLFLTEQEGAAANASAKRMSKTKHKSKDSKAHKYPINSLLSLLDRDIVIESSAVMQLLAELLARITYPLQALERRRKEAELEELRARVGEGVQDTHENQASAADPPAPATTAESGPAAAPPAEPGSEAAEGAAAQSASANKPQQDKLAAAQKKLRQLQPPVIPVQNLKLVVKIFVARECSSKTFQNTISTIKNLSSIPGAKAVFGQELVRQAMVLSELIVKDLDELLPHIEKASTGTEIQGVALAKFSPGASEQNKLLRVLTAFHHLFDKSQRKPAEQTAEQSGEGSSQPLDEKDELLSSIATSQTFNLMWDKLGACLAAIRQRENMLNVATILLPLIESLMVVCSSANLADSSVTQSQQNQQLVTSGSTASDTAALQSSQILPPSSSPSDAALAALFFSFTDAHRRILNELVRNNPKLMSGTFALLVKNPKVLEFDNKRNYFNRSIHSRANASRPVYPPLQLSVRRDHVFHDSFRSLYFKTGDEIKYGKLNVRFHGEEGVDAGGVTREWFQALSKQMFDPNNALFTPVSSDRTTFHPNKLSFINEEHLSFFKFVGRIIGKALYEGRVLDCYFSRVVYKRILGQPVSVKDMEAFDPEFYKSLMWMLNNDITNVTYETFSCEDDVFGVTKVVDLCENGRNIPVTEENKREYVNLLVEHKLLGSVKEQMEQFLKGKSWFRCGLICTVTSRCANSQTQASSTSFRPT